MRLLSGTRFFIGWVAREIQGSDTEPKIIILSLPGPEDLVGKK
jgi:hypothetical protein